VVRRNDIVRAYDVGAMRHEEARQRAEALRATADPRAEFVEILLAPDSCAVGHKVAELKLPRAALLVSIRRGRELVIPHGDTRLRAGDVVMALCQREQTAKVKELFAQAAPATTED
jgi:chloride channel protein, CIC family